MTTMTWQIIQNPSTKTPKIFYQHEIAEKTKYWKWKTKVNVQFHQYHSMQLSLGIITPCTHLHPAPYTSTNLSNYLRHSANANVIADVKSKIIVSCRHLIFADMIFSATQVHNYEYKTRENPYIQANTCIIIFQGILKIWECAIIFIDYRCLPCFFDLYWVSLII